ncbi:MAG: hypothetical protein AAFU49_12950 [Pseudomonadota bacterium]
MDLFDDIQDIRDWLEPLDYAGFWDAVAPFGLFAPEDRAHCDAAIADGVSVEQTVLACLKAMARIELADRFDLTERVYEPVAAQYLASTH